VLFSPFMCRSTENGYPLEERFFEKLPRRQTKVFNSKILAPWSNDKSSSSFTISESIYLLPVLVGVLMFKKDAIANGH
jgi:hypothetical protein